MVSFFQLPVVKKTIFVTDRKFFGPSYIFRDGFSTYTPPIDKRIYVKNVSMVSFLKN